MSLPTNTPTAETWPRPAYVIITIDSPSRRRTERTTLRHTSRVEDYDPEFQTPLTYALAATEDPEIRGYLTELAEDPYRSEDWYVHVNSDGTCVFDGPGRDVLGDIEYGSARETRAMVNP